MVFLVSGMKGAKQSAGILAFRRSTRDIEVFLVHPGGPYWAKRDMGVWSLPKGEFPEEEDGLAVAKREFSEETGLIVEGQFLPLGTAKQRGGKIVTAWAIEANLDPNLVKSNTFTMEWPPKSGRMQKSRKLTKPIGSLWIKRESLKGQAPFLDRLADLHLGIELQRPPIR